jgi:hypothetical protein
MAETFNCPSCGAPLETDGNETSIHCEYCGETVVVPQNLRNENKPAQGAAQFPTQPFQAGNFAGSIDRTQIRQMMVSIRAGQLEDAARYFQQGTGASESQARQTVELIANQLSGTNRIHPEMLGSLLLGTMGAMAQSAQIYSQAATQSTGQSYSQPLQPVAPIRPRRRSSLGCLLVLAIIAAALYLSYTSLNPALLLKSLISGNQNDQVRQTALAPIAQAQTAVATTVGSILSGGTSLVGSAAPLLTFGSEGIGQGMFKDARSIAIDAQGRIYTAEYSSGKVQVFDSQGKFLAQWMVDAKMSLLSMAVSPQGTVYIVQGGKIQSYDGMTGKALGAIAVPKATLINNVTLTSAGNLAAASFGAGDTILVLNPQGVVSLTISNAISGQSGDPEPIVHLAVDGLGNIYALGTVNNAVFKFSPEGKFITRFGSAGQDSGQFQAPEDIAVDGQGQVYVSDIKGIQVFSPDGRYLKTIKLPAGLPFGMAFNPNGDLVVTSRTKVYEFAVQ